MAMGIHLFTCPNKTPFDLLVLVRDLRALAAWPGVAQRHRAVEAGLRHGPAPHSAGREAESVAK